MAKKIKHRGMKITKEDKERHEKQGMPHLTPGKPEERPVNPFAVGGSFLACCVKKGWLKQEGKGKDTNYYFTPLGRIELKKLGIST